MAAITSLIVQTTTGTQKWAGTDGRVFFGIGPREWQLDNPGVDDFEEGATDTFVLQNLDGLDDSDIRRIRLRTESTDGWRPDRIKVFVNQPTSGPAFYSGSIDRWFDGGSGAQQKHGQLWEASNFPARFSGSAPAVTSLIVRITTADVPNAQTDDNVYFSIGTREWFLDDTSRNDFERGAADTFVLGELDGLRISDIRQIGLRKIGTNGWRPSRIQVWVNSDASAPEFFDGAVDLWLDGGAGAGNTHGLAWASRDFPQPSPQPVENGVTELRVVVKTAAGTHRGTDDGVYFDIGTREWHLDNAGHDDFRPGATDTFTLGGLGDMGGLRCSDFRRIGLRKVGTDGWRPERITVYVNGDAVPFYDGTVDVWLDGGGGAGQKAGLRWEARDFAYEIPVHCHLVVGENDSSIRPQRSRTASAELFANLNTAAYRRRAGSCDTYWTQGAVSFRVTGFTFAEVDDTEANMISDMDNADFTALRSVAAANNRADRLNVYFVRQTQTGSNWFVGGPDPACWVKDTRGGNTVGTTENFRRVAISTAHEIGHYFGLPHAGPAKQLMTGSGTTSAAQLLTKDEVDTARSNAAKLAD